MRILVVGRNGQLARSLMEKPLANVTVVARGRPEIDLEKPETITAAIKQTAPDIVVNAAAYNNVDQAESEETRAFAVNADGAGALGSAAAEAGVPVIHVSTDYVYDGTKQTPYVETDQPKPLGAYGRSKLAGEVLLAAAQPRHIILRTAWVHSPFGRNFVKTMLNLAAEHSEIRVVADQFGNPTYAPHLAAAIEAIAEQIVSASGEPPWGIYHAASIGETSWHGLAAKVFEEAQQHGFRSPRLVPITTSEYPTPARRPANSRLDCGRLAETFGVTLPHWTEGVADVVPKLLRQQMNEAVDANGVLP